MGYSRKGNWLVGVLLVAGAGCGTAEADKPGPDAAEHLPRLETVRPERTTVEVRRDFTAIVEAMEKTDLNARVAGVVKTIPAEVDIGRRIREGEVLITLDIPDVRAEQKHKKALVERALSQKEQAVQAKEVAAEELAEARALEKKYLADVEFRTLENQRVRKLVQRSTVQEQLAEESQMRLSSARAAHEAARAQIQIKQARLLGAEVDVKAAESGIKVARAEVERLNALVDFATIRAPFDGIITKRWVDHGATIKDPGMPLLTVMRTDVVRVLLDIPERDVPFIRAPGQPTSEDRGNRVVLRIPALKEVVPGGKFQGRVTLLASALDPVTRTMRAEVHLDNRAGHLRPQMTGTASVVLTEREQALTVPSSALVRTGPKVEVFHVSQRAGSRPGVVRRAEVGLGLDDGRRVEIRKGLTGKEWVVLKANASLREDEPALGIPVR